MVKELLIIGAGGFIGAIFRYFLSTLFSKWTILSIPTGTYIINVLGSFAIGFIYGANYFSENQMIFISIGFLGAFTTFSTFNYELLQLKDENKAIQFWAYGASMYASNIMVCFWGYWWGNN
ncbi:fluoride efflux transporter CrcB [Neobacillus sp.]|uniref:fluoride efflux transporter CrcB n=1 Tax=Neobacillus sp. TaxID=2675273 RepID=UPI0028A22F46|nr:fluoride efflux transporter CrcB [Neobacillus sp.]